MLMTPSLSSYQAFTGFGQDGIRHDLNRLYYNDLSRQGMIDPQLYGAPYYAAYNPMTPWSYASSAPYGAPYYAPTYPGYEARYAYARPYDGRGFDYARPYDGRTLDYARPYDGRSYDYARPYDGRAFDYARPGDLGFARPYDYTRAYETMRPQELPYARSYEVGLPYARTSESMIRPIEGQPGFGTDAFTVPAMNSAETPDAYLIVVELPGVDLKDVNLQIHGSSLVLNAFRRPTWSNGTVTVNYHFAEGRFGTLRRVLPLPVGVLPGQIQANFLNGLLTIVLPKSGSGATLPQASIVINSNVPTTM